MKQSQYILSILVLLTMISTAAFGQADKGKTNQDIFYEASKEKILGNLDKAIGLYNRCLQMDPEDAASMYELALIYQEQDRNDDAIALMEDAIEIDPENFWYKSKLIQLYQAAMKYDEAGKLIDELLKKEPNRIDLLQDQALNYLYARQFKDAIKTYDLIEEKIGVTEQISLQKQKIYQMTNKPEKAIEEIERLSEAIPMESKYLEILAELYLANQMYDEALETYNKVLELDPENPYINISLSDFYRKQGDMEKSYEYLKSGFANPNLDIDTKVQILLAYYSVNEIYNDLKEEAFELAALMVEAHPNEPKAYSIYADLLYQDSQFEEARKAFRTVISMDSSKYLVWEQLLFVESELADFKAMADESRRAIILFPQQPLLYLFSGVSSFQQQDYERAAKDLKTGLKFVVANNAMLAQFYSYLGDAYYQLDDFKKSDEAYENVLKIDPDNSLVLNNYSYYLSVRGEKLDKAEKMARHAVELDPENGANQDTYGWVLYKMGKYEEAKEWIGKAIKNREESGVVLEHYGDVLYQLGDSKGAVKYWEKAKKAGGGTELLDKKLQDKKLYE